MKTTILLFTLGAITPTTIYLMVTINYYMEYIGTFFTSDPTAEVYDFIVVGAGSSGAVVACRLAQYYKVLLIEAGGDPIHLSNIPGLAMDLLGYPDYDWFYKSVPQENVAKSLKNKQFYHNRGRVLGGSSTLNYMMYLRGHPLDYDNWATITGDGGWSYDNMLPFFKKSIYEYRGAFQENRKHYEASPYGFLTIEKVNWKTIGEYFIEAGKELGLGSGIDANGPQTRGTGSIEVTERNGRRSSTYTALLSKASNLKNLRIAKYSQATKILLDKSNTARGVWFQRFGKKYLARASKEVIVSAGTYDSAKLLMLSGIGPKLELEKIGIKSKVDLPVGKNLHDHFALFINGFVSNTSSSFQFERDFGLGDFYEFFVKGTGCLTAPTGMTSQMFFASSKSEQKEWSDIQTYLIPVAISDYVYKSFGRALSVRQDLLEEYLEPINWKDSFMLLTALVRPKSRGQVTLQDKNPFSDPLIDTRPFTHPDDMKILIEGIHASIDLVAKSKGFKKIGVTFEPPVFPGCKHLKFLSDEYWECFARHAAVTIWHPVGTCRMGKRSDRKAVVDSQLKVLGNTKGLRVIDCSVMPAIVNANTNAPAIVIGEKGADMILNHWASQREVSLKSEYLKYLNQTYYGNFITRS